MIPRRRRVLTLPNRYRLAFDDWIYHTHTEKSATWLMKRADRKWRNGYGLAVVELDAQKLKEWRQGQ